MEALPTSQSRRSRRATWIRASGWLILLLAVGAALLPWVDRSSGALVIGGMMLAGGLIEIFAGTLRHETPKLAITAGVVTMIAGALFLRDLASPFAPFLTIVMGWLFARGVLLTIASRLEHGGLRFWTGVAAATDLALAVLLAIGLSIAGVVLVLFDAAEPLVASFAWVLAISFIATGLLLLEVASCAPTEDI